MDGTTVQFSCVVVAEEIDYFVNNTPTNQPNIVDAGFKESTVDNLNDTTRRLNLTATALSQYNNTEVLCRGLNTVGIMTFPTFSEVAVLLVQGKLITTYSPLYNYSDNYYIRIVFFKVHYRQLLIHLMICLILQVSISHGIHHSLFLGHISLDITYQLLVSCSKYLSLLLILTMC